MARGDLDRARGRVAAVREERRDGAVAAAAVDRVAAAREVGGEARRAAREDDDRGAPRRRGQRAPPRELLEDREARRRLARRRRGDPLPRGDAVEDAAVGLDDAQHVRRAHGVEADRLGQRGDDAALQGLGRRGDAVRERRVQADPFQPRGAPLEHEDARHGGAGDHGVARDGGGRARRVAVAGRGDGEAERRQRFDFEAAERVRVAGPRRGPLRGEAVARPQVGRDARRGGRVALEEDDGQARGRVPRGRVVADRRTGRRRGRRRRPVPLREPVVHDQSAGDGDVVGRGPRGGERHDVAARAQHVLGHAVVLGPQKVDRAVRVHKGLQRLAAHLDGDPGRAPRRAFRKVGETVVAEVGHRLPRVDGVRRAVEPAEARAHAEAKRRAELGRGPPEHAVVAARLAPHDADAEEAVGRRC